MTTVDETRTRLGIVALDTFAADAFGHTFGDLEADDRADALFDLLTALRVVAEGDAGLDWAEALERCDEFTPVRARGELP